MISLFVNNDTSYNKIISALGNQVILSLNPPILLDDKKKYEMRLLNANIVYCMPNVTSVNNTLTYTYQGYTHNIVFDTGIYSLDDINVNISLYTAIGNNGGDGNLIVFSADESTSKIYCFFDQPNVVIDCGAPNSIMPMLGFPASSGLMGGLIIASWIKSATSAQLNSIQNILVKCDATTGSYSNGQLSNVIACVVPNVTSYSTIIYTPVHPTRCPINVRRLDSITFTLVDQNNNDIDMGTSGGTLSPELWSIVITIEEEGKDAIM
jgi:hypothetical protein